MIMFMSSFLLPDEKILLKDECDCKWKSPDSSGSEMRQIILTDKRLIYAYSDDEEDESIIDWKISCIQEIYIEKPFFGNENHLVIVVTADEEYSDTVYKIAKLSNLEMWETKLQQVKEYDQKSQSIKWALTKILKSQEKTTFDEVLKISKDWLMLAYGSKMVNDEVQVKEILTSIISDLIAHNQIEGFIDKDKKQFLHKIAYQQKSEVVQYNIATSFEFGVDGVISLKCPNCGASKSYKEKSSQIQCEYCHSTYIVPKKVLDLI